jgi:anti-sigma regulatory factor (Ser/Thr protein kinase)
MPPLRARLEAWLGNLGVEEMQRHDTILAVSEACNNAIEHAYESGQGTIHVVLEHDAERLRITIEDTGRWRTPLPDPTRGRGILIMQRIMDNTQIDAAPGGTRVGMELRL